MLLEKDEEKLINMLSVIKSKGNQTEVETMKNNHNKLKARMKEIDFLAKKLFEERFAGNVPEDNV